LVQDSAGQEETIDRTNEGRMVETGTDYWQAGPNK
jgi:hypothetical protein